VKILLLTNLEHADEAEILPALDLLSHAVRTSPCEPAALVTGAAPDVVMVDGSHGLAEARATCRMLRSTGLGIPLIAVVTEPGLAAVSTDWGVDDVILVTAGPAEIEARLRLTTARLAGAAPAVTTVIRCDALTIDPETYAARLRGEPLILTFKEFELLKYLAQQPGRVFTRDHLLREVWGYDYFGGSRTVDVHVRRLRAKLGSQYESMIATVRQVGYKLVTAPAQARPFTEPAEPLITSDSR